MNFVTPASSTLTGPISIPVSAYTTATTGIPQPSTTQRLDTLGDRLMYRLGYRNLGGRESLTVNHITERKNNPAIVKGGGFTARFAHKKVADQGGTIEALDINTKVHMVADEDHSDMFEPIYDKYIIDDRVAQAVIRAAQDSLAIDRAYRSALATAMGWVEESAAA